LSVFGKFPNVSTDPPTDDETGTGDQEPTETIDSAPAASDVSKMTESGPAGPATPDGDDSDFAAAIQSVPWVSSVLAGAGSFLGGYVLMAALFFVGPASAGNGPLAEQLKQIGYVFYNAHFVDGLISVSSEQIQLAGSPRVNLLLDEGVVGLSTSIPIPVYLAVPVVTLLVAGGLLATYRPDVTTDSVSIGLTGAGMALGYALLALAGTFVVVRSLADGSASYAPDRLQTLALGFAYPFVVGIAGMIVGSLLDRA